MRRDENYKADLLAELRSDPVYASDYLSAAKADSNEAFLVALRDVAEALMGMQKVAKKAKLNRENLYRALSRKGNPRIDTLDSVLAALGIGIKFVLKPTGLAAVSPPDRFVFGEPTPSCVGPITMVGGGEYESSGASAARPYQGDDYASVPLPLLIQAIAAEDVLGS
jgi:probable addiction module antidote protein